MNVVQCTPVDIGRWRELAGAFADYNYRQVWGFGQACAARRGAVSEHVAVTCGADVVALADVRIKRSPLWRVGIAYVNAGPLVRRDGQGDPQRLALALEALHHTYVEQRRLLLRLAPSAGPPEWNAQQQEVFTSAGFEQSGGPRHRTILIDLGPSPAELRKCLNAKWRNDLHRAEHEGLTVRSGRDEALFAAFCRLYDELVERKEFTVDLEPTFYAGLQTRLAENEKFEISLAEMSGEPVAGHVAALHGDTAVYLLGASSTAGLKTRASFLLQWEVLMRARSRGFRWYDLGGIDPQTNPGVYRFKRRMGGVEVTAAGPFEAAPGELRRLIVRGGERVYRVMHARLGAAR
jgi:CelD/BcsL family acetyltransferase involved in cellulose biosynthesis